MGLIGVFKAGCGYFGNSLKNNLKIPLQAYSFGISIFSALVILSHYGLIPSLAVIDTVNKYLSAGNIPGVLPGLFLISVLILYKENLRQFNSEENTKLRRRKALSATMVQSIILIFGLLGALAGFALKAFPEAITNQLFFIGLSSSMFVLGIFRDRLARWIVQFY